MPSAALCLLGSVRTLALECTGATTLQRIATPIGAAVFAFINVPEEWSANRVDELRALVRERVRDANLELRALEVDNRSPPNRVWRGVSQAKGLKRCWEVVGQTGAFEYIVRVRTDVYHGFALPPRLPNGPPTSVAHVGFLGAPGCSKRRKAALWVDDRFAVLRGRQAQRVFLRDFADALQALPSGERGLWSERAAAPECVLGIEVDYANAQGAEAAVALRDVRKLVTANGSGACRRANAQIVRSKNCSAEIGAAPWVCPPEDQPPPTLTLE